MSALAALLVAGALFVAFARLERSGRSGAVVALVLAALLVDAVVYPDQSFVPDGLLHPEYRGQSFRLVDLLIPAAILARLLHRPRRRPSALVLPWLAFLAWIATAGVIGAYEGHPLSIVAFQGKAIIYLGSLLVAAGVPVEQYLRGRGLERYLAAAAALAALLIATDVAGITVDAALPLVPLSGFGPVGADAASMFCGLGVVALVLGLLGPRAQRSLPLASAAVLLATPLVADQRAAFIGLGLALAIVLAAIALTRRRVAVAPAEALLAAGALAALLALSTVPAALEGKPVKLPLQDELSATFGAYEEVLTTEDRVNQWAQARPLIEAEPVYGHGLGVQYVFWNQGYWTFTKTDLTHNILADLLLRTGAVGLALFLLALGLTTAGAARAWLASRSNRCAAFALGVGAAVVGLVGKGMAESLFEKYRLAAALGLGVGIMISTASARDDDAQGAAST